MALLTVHETPDNSATTKGVCYLHGSSTESSFSILPSEVAHGDAAPRACGRMPVMSKTTRVIPVSVEFPKEGQWFHNEENDSLTPLGFRASTGCPLDHRVGGIMSRVELLASKGRLEYLGSRRLYSRTIVHPVDVPVRTRR